MMEGLNNVVPLCGKEIVFLAMKETHVDSLDVGNEGGIMRKSKTKVSLKKFPFFNIELIHGAKARCGNMRAMSDGMGVGIKGNLPNAIGEKFVFGHTHLKRQQVRKR
jgi:hypothetical protein